MLTIRIVTLSILITLLGAVSCHPAGEEPKQDPVKADTTDVELEFDTAGFTFNEENEWLGIGTQEFGDLDSMVERRKIRALVPYTHLYYYIDGKQRKGVAFEVLTMFEKALNEQLKLKRLKVQVIFIPVNRSQVIPLLRDGYGDVAYAGMTITEERRELADFSIPTITGLKEIVVGGPASPKLNSLADLSGKQIFVHAGSSYESAIIKLSDSLVKAGMKPVIIKHVDPYLETEDMLDMVSCGAIPYTATVADMARLWTNVLDSMVLYEQFPLASEVSYGWVFRKDSPKLKATADKFIAKHAFGTRTGNTMYAKYVKNTKLLPGKSNKRTQAQVKALHEIFQKYSDKYQVDQLLMVAQGYQESQLNQHLTSPAGAVGVMQVLPTTAAGYPIHIKDVSKVDPNIHAGIKYMRYLINTHFNDPEIDVLNRQLFALAAYNCGPGRMNQMRRMAKAKNLNPNLWFDNVEVIAARVIGRETVDYVSNIYKFYASYRALDYYTEQRGKKTMH